MSRISRIDDRRSDVTDFRTAPGPRAQPASVVSHSIAVMTASSAILVRSVRKT